MPMCYNLRSLEKRKNRNCYLQKFLENNSPETFSPVVCLERLNLEYYDVNSNQQYVKKNKSNVEEKNFPKNTKFFFQLLCCIVLLLVCLLYWKESRFCGIFKNLGKLYPAVLHFYSNAVAIYQRDMKHFTKFRNGIQQPNSVISKGNDTFMLKDFEIRALVRDYIVKLSAKNTTPKVFIEEQCKRNDNMEQIDNELALNEINFNDYALESLGAEIVTIFDTETYNTLNMTMRFLGYEMWPKGINFLLKNINYLVSNGPNSILIPWKKPGDCWAFKGSCGRVMIKLSEKIFVRAITIDHIPKGTVLNESFHSAPKKFSVIGLTESFFENEKIHLGTFEYMYSGPAIQTFLIQPKRNIAFRNIEIVFESNHGNREYTCVYKVRVHGHE